MCLSTQALLLFLSLLPSDRIESAVDRIVVHADAGPAVWNFREDSWCTEAPGPSSDWAGPIPER